MKKILGKSWKTSLAGIFTILPVIGHVIFPTVFTPEVTALLSSVAVTGGFAASKDKDVTGTGK